MDPFRIGSIFIAIVVIVPYLSLGVSEVRAQPDLSLVSQRYNEESFSNEIVGEVMNNGSEVAEFAEATASFYDTNGQIVGTEFAFADPSTIQPGMKSPFTILITGETINSEAASYSLTLQWQDSEANEVSKLVLENEPIISSTAGQESSSEEDSE